MADDRIDVIVADKIAPSVAPKLKEIARHSREAYTNVNKLAKALTTIKASAIQQLSNSAVAAATNTVKLQTAQAKLANQQNITATSAAKLGVQQAKLGQAQNNTAISAQRLAQQQAKTATANTQAAAAAVRHQQALQRLQQQQQRLATGGGSLNQLRVGTILAGATTTGGILSVIQLTDAYQRFQQRVDAVTESLAVSAAVQGELQRVANLTYTAIDVQAELFQRFDPIMSRYGKTIADTVEFQTNLSKAIALSGATAAETEGALRQLAQAASGDFKTSAQELNSILEQAPKVAQVFAAQLGVLPFELKKMAEAGKVSTKDLIAAFTEGGEAIEELQKKFFELNPTISQALQNFRTNLIITTGEIATATGAASLFTDTIFYLSQNMEIVVGIAIPFFVLLTASILSSNAAMALFNTTVLLNPLVLGGALLAGAIAVMVALAVEIKGVDAVMADFNETATNALLGATLLTYRFIQALDYIPGIDLSGPLNDIAEFGNKLIEARKNGEPLLKVLDLDIPRAAARTTGAAEEIDDWFAKVRTGGFEAGQAAVDSFTRAANAIDSATQSLEEYNKQVQKAGGAKITHIDTSGTSTSDIMKIPGTSSSSIRGVYDFSDGGPVRGPGTARSDSIPANLSNGEFVVNAAATARHRQLLEAINRSEIRNFAEGGYAAGDFSQTAQKESGTSGSFALGGSELDDIMASGFSPYIGTGGHSGGYEFTGPYSPEIEEAFLEQSAAIATWTKELKTWWTATKPTIADETVQSTTDSIVSAWLAGLPKYTVDPREYIEGGPIGVALNPAFDRFLYKFEDVTGKIAKAGYTASILSNAPPWSDTVGNYVSYSGPSFGQAITYGGEISGTSYAAEAADTAASVPKDVTEQQIDDFFYGGFQNGGRFTVQGSGGTDSSLVQFRATPGEQVTVTPPNSHAPQTPVYQINIGEGAIQVTTPNVAGFKESEAEIIGRLAGKIQDHLDRINR